jgi:hypothetical protein
MRGFFHAATESRPALEISLIILNVGLLAAIVIPAIHA